MFEWLPRQPATAYLKAPPVFLFIIDDCQCAARLLSTRLALVTPIDEVIICRCVSDMRLDSSGPGQIRRR